MSFQPSDLGYDELDWWRARLEQEGREAVRQSCLKLGLHGLVAISLEHTKALTDALGTTVRKREALLRRAPDSTRLHALLLCAHYRLGCACMWIDTAGPYASDYLAGGASPKRVHVAASVVADLLERLPYFWPFDDGTDPLGEGLPLDADDEEPDGD